MFENKYPVFFTVPLLSYFGYTFYKHLEDPQYMSMVDRVDFFIHELGHLVFAVFGNFFLSVAGGTILQLLIPTLLLIMFIFQRDNFAVALCLAWIGTNFFYISMYSGDAIVQLLPLIGFGQGTIVHDWNYMFSELNILDHTNNIAFSFYILAIVFYMLGFLYGGMLIVSRLKRVLK